MKISKFITLVAAAGFGLAASSVAALAVPAVAKSAANENAMAGARVNPTGPYGPNTCIAGYVWREAYTGDKVCVTLARRIQQVHNENIQGPSHRVNP